MSESFFRLVPALSDKELYEYLRDPSSLLNEDIEIAIAELKRRGREIPASAVMLSETQSLAQSKPPKYAIFTNWNRNVVTDLEAPELYSQSAISGFSVAMNPLFGMVLFSMNLYRLNKKKYILPALLVGIIWQTFFALYLNHTPTGRESYLYNALGASLILYALWPWLIGELKYRTRPIWIPLAFAVILSAIFIWATFSSK